MLEGFSWLDANREAYCVTFVQGLDATALLRRLDGDLSKARLIQQGDWQALEELSLFGGVIRVGQCEGWAFVYEDNGPLPRPEAIRALSAGTVAVAVYHNVNAVTNFCYAEDGTVVADFDPIHAQDWWFFEQASPQVLALLDQAGITPRDGEDEDDENEEDDDFDFVSAMFALAEATGVRLDRASIAEQPLLCSSIRSPFSDFVGDVLSRGVSNEPPAASSRCWTTGRKRSGFSTS